MKTNRVVVGAVAAAMLSLAICPIASVAAGETVQISVGTAEAKAGEKFSVDVSLSDISTPGIQNVDFAIAFDSSVINIDSVEAGTLANNGAADKDGSGAGAPIFEASIHSEGFVSLIWSTGLDDASYWLNGSGVFCTITGTVSSSAAAGTETPLTVTAVDRPLNPDTTEKSDIYAGYADSQGNAVEFTVSTSNGSVKVLSDSNVNVVRGDANCDSKVDLSDAVLIMQSIANPDKYGESGSAEGHITAQGKLNGDVAGLDNDMGGDGITSSDALKIQKYKLNLISESEF